MNIEINYMMNWNIYSNYKKKLIYYNCVYKFHLFPPPPFPYSVGKVKTIFYINPGPIGIGVAAAIYTIYKYCINGFF